MNTRKRRQLRRATRRQRGGDWLQERIDEAKHTKMFDVTGMNLTSLPELPDSIKYVICNENQLTSLPTLPYYLKVLSCSENKLVELPDLPESLSELHCVDNLLKKLPELNEALISLHCGRNRLHQLPALNKWLGILDCEQNQLSSLPSLPDSLTMLNCSDNRLKKLPKMPPFLKELHCSGNQLTTLPLLPPSLKVLVCENNPWNPVYAKLLAKPNPIQAVRHYQTERKKELEIAGRNLMRTRLLMKTNLPENIISHIGKYSTGIQRNLEGQIQNVRTEYVNMK